MAVFEEDLFAFWMANPDLGAGSPVIKLFPGKLPPNPTFPTTTYTRVSGPGEETHNAPTGYVDARYQFSIYDDDWKTCWEAAKRVKRVFRRFRGNMGSTEVQSSRIANDNDSADPPTGLPRRIVDVIIRHREEL